MILTLFLERMFNAVTPIALRKQTATSAILRFSGGEDLIQLVTVSMYLPALNDREFIGNGCNSFIEIPPVFLMAATFFLDL